MMNSGDWRGWGGMLLCARGCGVGMLGDPVRDRHVAISCDKFHFLGLGYQVLFLAILLLINGVIIILMIKKL